MPRTLHQGGACASLGISTAFFNLKRQIWPLVYLIPKIQSARMKKLGLIAAICILVASFAPRTLTWVAIGDSITYLNDHPDETGSRITMGYMTMVCAKVPGLLYSNQGHNGWTSGGIAHAIEGLGITKADIYTIFLGTNDWWQGRPAGSFSDYRQDTGDSTVSGSFRIIIDKVRSLNPGAKVILLTPMQRSDFVYIKDLKNNAYGSYREKNGQSLEKIANAIRTIGEFEHFTVIDLYHTRPLSIIHLVKYKRLKDPTTGLYRDYTYPAYTDIPFNPLTDEYPYPPGAVDKTFDGLHPSDDGYAIIADLLVKAIGKK